MIGKFNRAVVSKTVISRKITEVFLICLENAIKRMLIFEFSEYIIKSLFPHIDYMSAIAHV